MARSTDPKSSYNHSLGYHHGLRGLPETNNPFAEDTKDSLVWLSGWRSGHDDWERIRDALDEDSLGALFEPRD